MLGAILLSEKLTGDKNFVVKATPVHFSPRSESQTVRGRFVRTLRALIFHSIVNGWTLKIKERARVKLFRGSATRL